MRLFRVSSRQSACAVALAGATGSPLRSDPLRIAAVGLKCVSGAGKDGCPSVGFVTVRYMRRKLTAIFIAFAVTASLAACGSSTKVSPETDTAPQRGGDLVLLGSGDVDFLDPAAAYHQVSSTILRALTRQLVSYPDSSNRDVASTPAPDLAAALPVISADGLEYTFKLRSDIKWNLAGGRAITSPDVVRGIKRLCNPVAAFGGVAYFTDAIAGFAAFCDGFQRVPANVNAIRSYVENTPVTGLQAVDASTVKFVLTGPHSEFLNMLALTAASPAPIEFLQALPNSAEFRSGMASSGPYQIASYDKATGYRLERNPFWVPASDPIRKAYVDTITITFGSTDEIVYDSLQNGKADMSWDTVFSKEQILSALKAGDERLALTGDGASGFLVLNTVSPNENGALKDVRVRQALNYAVDKSRIVDLFGGSDVKDPIDQILTPTLVGYSKIDPFPTPAHKGDIAKAKSLLAEAGYPNGLKLTMVFSTLSYGKGPAIARIVAEDLSKAGITVFLKQVEPQDIYPKYLQNTTATKNGDWDIAADGWVPDWQGNGAITFFKPLLDGRAGKGCTVATANSGCYNNDKLNAVIDQAIAATDPAEAAALWAKADAIATADAPWVPLVTGRWASYHGTRVQNWNFGTLSGNGDITNVWLKK